MRTYISNPDRDQTGKKELYRTRTSDEWDLSFNMPADGLYIAQSIVTTIKDFIDKHPGLVIYALVGGIELGTNDRSETTKDEHHVHCALVVTEHMTKDQALRCFELDEVHQHNNFKRYAAPRSGEWPYIGWKLHHIKVDTKIDPTSTVLFEHGTLPKDSDTPGMIKKIAAMKRKFANDYVPRAERPPAPKKPKMIKEETPKAKKTVNAASAARKRYFSYLNAMAKKHQ